ncbi:zinc-binding dehydrogenase [Variovorax paradoxus]|uniref:Alcohol dehydrogenase n=1 Tax=Variovorax paradoxus TaxID=34073 RepID=A0A0H2LR86_VARPD|nr:zinc-binding dehydrogenase [Variovorax paradoxus]KLN52823.1 alcohol dehydrogenase [Variovorax paradoxus]
MKVLLLQGPGQPLLCVDRPDVPPAPSEATVLIRCAALNHRDVWIQKGDYHVLKYPVVPGADGAGIVTAVGEGVDASLVGNEVIINPGLSWGPEEDWAAPDFYPLGSPRDGTFAEYINVPAVQLARKPAHLDWVHAAALPLSGVTAFRAVRSRAGLRAGERVLITGVGGGVALFAMQFALALGAQVYATSGSDEKAARVRALGVSGTANYRDPNWPAHLRQQVPQGFDVIIDSAMGPGFQNLVELAAPGGRIAFLGFTAGGDVQVDVRPIYRKQLSILGTKMGSPRDFAAMVGLVESSGIQPIVDRALPLSRANEAYGIVDRGEQFGKIVLVNDLGA